MLHPAGNEPIFDMEKLAKEYLQKSLRSLCENNEPPRLTISVPQVARLTGVNVTKAYEIVKRKDFPKLILGKRIVVPVIPFLRWLEEQATNGNK